MNMKSIARDLAYRGEVTGKRQTYYVYEGRRHYLVLSRSRPGSGNFNVIMREAVDYVRMKFSGVKGITSQDVVKQSKNSQYIKSALNALNILYVLVALKAAGIDRRRSAQKQLFFNIQG